MGRKYQLRIVCIYLLVVELSHDMLGQIGVHTGLQLVDHKKATAVGLSEEWEDRARQVLSTVRFLLQRQPCIV